MNPNRGENINLPAPVEQTTNNEVVEDSSNEKQAVAAESSPSRQTTAPALPTVPAVMPVASNPVLPTDDDRSDNHHRDTNDSANPDRIEKQWIDKAKAIVADTKTDPYKQKSEMSKAKAEYIKSRFNKVLKTQT